MENIRIGIIGLGAMGAKHLSVYSSLPDVTVVGISDFNEALCRSLSGKYGGIPYYTDYRKMLDEQKPEAVAIAVPDAAHYKPVMDCLAADCHVLIEKPLAVTLADADEMIGYAAKQNKILMVNFSHRWVASYFNANKISKSGDLGNIVMVYAKKNDPISVIKTWPWLKDSSPSAFLSSHDIDLVRWFMGCEVKSVFARGHKSILRKKLGYENTWDCIQASVEFENSAIAVFESSFVYPSGFPTCTDSYIQLNFEDGVIRIPRLSEGLEIATEDGFELPKLGIAVDFDGEIYGAFRMAGEHFIQCIRNGETPLTSGKNARQVAEIVEAIHRSLDTGRVISLPLEE